jgi:hypothetical protein
MRQTRVRIIFVVTLIASLLMSACSTQLSIGRQLNESGNSGAIGLDVGLGSNNDTPESNSGQESDDSSSVKQQNEVINPSSQGFLILIGIGLLIMIGLVINLMSQNKAEQ